MEKRAEAEWEKYNMSDCCETECADECNVEQCCVDCEENAEKPAANLTISQLFDQMYDAIQNDDKARFIELAKVVDSWGDELTPAQEEELEAYAMQNFEKMMVVMEAVEMIDLDEYEGDCDCCVDCEEPMLYEGDCDCCVDCEETMFYEDECCDEDYEW
jgi:hypothetical protein